LFARCPRSFGAADDWPEFDEVEGADAAGVDEVGAEDAGGDGDP
jgi:hypothetical protein